MKPLTLKDRFRLSRFFQGEQPTDAAIELNQRRIFILPTQRGIGFCILILLILLIAFVYNNNLAYLLAFLLASIFFITILHTYQALSGLQLQTGQSHNVFAGELAEFALEIANPGNRPRYKVQIASDLSKYLMLPAHSKTISSVYFATQQRGKQAIGKIAIASSFPFGLFRAWSPLRFSQTILVYPKPASRLLPFPEAPCRDPQQGSNKTGIEDYYGLKTYQPGDAIKNIDWKTYAKGFGLYSKQYGGSGSNTEIWLDYDSTAGSIEERLSQLCRWVLDAEQAGVYYGFSLPGKKLMPDHGLSHYRKCLEALALF